MKTRIKWIKDPVKDIASKEVIQAACGYYTCRPVVSCGTHCGIMCQDVEGPYPPKV